MNGSELLAYLQYCLTSLLFPQAVSSRGSESLDFSCNWSIHSNLPAFSHFSHVENAYLPG